MWNGRFRGSRRLRGPGSSANERTAVLEHETDLVRHVMRAEIVEVALDQAHAVEIVIDDGQVDGIGLGRFAGAGVLVWPGRD